MGVTQSERQFAQYEPLLWRVLGKLAHDGFPVQPQDARDLIHDFYLDWPALNCRYDKEKGDFAPYLVAAFYRFGRRRQLQMHRLQARALDIEQCVELTSPEAAPAEAAETKQLAARLRAALGALPPAERAILADYLSGQAQGEREQAAKHRLTRYRLREVLAAAVSRIALRLAAEGRQSPDGAIAYRVWVADQSPRTVAAELGISTEQVNQAKSRFAQALLNAVREGHHAHY